MRSGGQGQRALRDHRGRRGHPAGRRKHARLACRDELLARQIERQRLFDRHRTRQPRPHVRLSPVPRRTDRRARAAAPSHRARLRHSTRQRRRPFGHRPAAQARSRASCSHGSGWRNTGSRCRGRRGSSSAIRSTTTARSTSRSNASATTFPRARRRSRPSSGAGGRRRSTARSMGRFARSCSSCSWIATRDGLDRLRQGAGQPRREFASAEESPGSTKRGWRVTPAGSGLGPAQGQCHREYTADGP